MILVLEDEDWRIKFFVEKMGAKCFARVDAFLEALTTAIAAIDRGDGLGERVDAIYLDHDLGYQVYEPYPREVTGLDACNALAGMPIDCPVYVHSMNPVGAARMMASLRDSGFKANRVLLHELFKVYGWDVPAIGATP